MFNEHQHEDRVTNKIFDHIAPLKAHPLFEDFVRVFKIDLEGRSMDCEEMLWMLSILHKNAEREQRFAYLFKVFDVDMDKLISKDDLRTIVFKLYGFSLSHKDNSQGDDKEFFTKKLNEYIDHLFETYDGDQDDY